MGDIYGASYANEDDVKVHGCAAARSCQIRYKFGVLCLGMLKLPLGPCVFTVLDFHKVDVSIPGRN